MKNCYFILGWVREWHNTFDYVGGHNWLLRVERYYRHLDLMICYIMRWLWVYGLWGKLVKFECQMLPISSCIWTLGPPIVVLFEKVVKSSRDNSVVEVSSEGTHHLWLCLWFRPEYSQTFNNPNLELSAMPVVLVDMCPPPWKCTGK